MITINPPYIKDTARRQLVDLPAHHEPVCFAVGNIIGTTYARDRFRHVPDIFLWMNISGPELFYGVDGVLKEADHIDNIH